MQFWLRELAFFVPKAALKEEQAQPVTAMNKKKRQRIEPCCLPGSHGTGLQSKTKNIEDSIIALKGTTDTQDTDIIAAEQIVKKANNSTIPYADFVKICNKKKLKKQPHMLVLLMKRHGIIDLLYPDDEATPAIPPPPQKENGEVMVFTDVLEGLGKNNNELIVEPDCFDFGTNEKVSDYD
jgi:hypothetical protein